MSRKLTDLADVLRAAGMVVVELDGWQTRGRSGNSDYADGRPWCVMWHHTASGGDGADDADYCTFRSSDRPLCNLVIGRDAVVYVCAAGPTNTNGKGQALAFSRGTVPADSMNTYAVGIEISNGGTGMPYPQVQVDACMAASLAICAAYGLTPTDVSQHADYAVGRKIDPATAPAVEGPWQPRSANSSGSWVLADLRAELTARSDYQPPPDPPPPMEEDVSNVLVLEDARNGAWYRCGPESKSWVRDGNMSAQLIARLDETARDGVAVDGFRYTEMTNGNVDLIRSTGPIVGPMPDGVDEYGG